jgi:hypothetical protein
LGKKRKRKKLTETRERERKCGKLKELKKLIEIKKEQTREA